jgi:hypothetical protein
MDYMNQPDNTIRNIWLSIGAVVLFIAFLMLVMPMYNVWSAGKAGQATLKHADFEREVQVVNAKANLEAQKYNAEAEVARANGVAQANHVIKDSITELYIRYLWVQTLDRTNNQIIYVPLGQDGLPVTEAGRAVTNK